MSLIVSLFTPLPSPTPLLTPRLQIVEHLDDLRRNPQKFICINDNMNHSKESAHLAKLYIRDYFESVLPKPSQFELPPNYRNRFLHVDDLEEW